MNPSSLVYPMAALVLLTFGVAVVLFRARVRAVREGHTPVSYFRVFQGSVEPESVAKPTRHFANLFETPVLFYTACLAAMIVGARGLTILVLAWAFVAARLIHAFIHLGSNRVRYRLQIFFASWVILIAMWICVVLVVTRRGT